MRMKVVAASEVVGWAIVLLGAIPIAVAKEVSYPPRNDIGVQVIDIAPGLEDVVGIPTTRGAYVLLKTNPGPPPAEASGVLEDDFFNEGDLIVRMNERPVQSAHEFSELLKSSKLGEKLKVLVIRKGREEVVSRKVRGIPPLIYLPVSACPIATERILGGSDTATVLFFGVPFFGILDSSQVGECRFPTQPCTPLELEKQDESRTLIQINTITHEIVGNWRAHTHLTREECLEERSKLESLRVTDAH